MTMRTMIINAGDIKLGRCEIPQHRPSIFLEINNDKEYNINDWKMLVHFLNELTQEEANGITVDELRYLSAHAPFRMLIEEFLQIGYRLNTKIGLTYKDLPHKPSLNIITGIVKNIENTNRWGSFRGMVYDIMKQMPVYTWSNCEMFFNHHKIKLNNKDKIYTTYPVISIRDETQRHFIDIVILNENRMSIRGRYLFENWESFVQPLPYRLVRGPHTIRKEELKLILQDYVAALHNSWTSKNAFTTTLPSWSDQFSFHEINRDQHYIFDKFVKPE